MFWDLYAINLFVRLIQTNLDGAIRRAITIFSPDIIISYNNVLPGYDIYNYTNCPIIVYPADVFRVWAGIELLKTHIDRYYFLDATERITSDIKKNLPEVKNNQFIPFGHATGVKAMDLPQDINISFVGSLGNYAWGTRAYFSNLYKYVSYDEANSQKDAFIKAYRNHLKDDNDIVYSDFMNSSEPVVDRMKDKYVYELNTITACNKRFSILSKLTELDIEIHGYPYSWGQIVEFNIDLLRCFNYKPSVSLEDTMNLYNRSKVSVNLPQGVNTEGFSWRVPDILASNAVLLSVPKGDLVRLMKTYYKDFPYYETANEALSIAKKMLLEDNWRRELIEASHCLVENEFRYPKKLKYMKQAIGIDICNVGLNGGLKIITENEICHTYNRLEKIINRHSILRRCAKKIYLIIYKKV